MNKKNQSVSLRSAVVPILFVVAAYSINNEEITKPVSLPPETYVENVSEIPSPLPPERGGLYNFLDAIGHRESSNRYHAVNRFGYLGKYQFSPRTLFSLGEEFQVDRRSFLENPALQDSAMIEYLKYNRRILGSLIRRYDGRTFNGIQITESGLLAGAHLVGAAGVRSFFDSEYLIEVDGKEIRPKTTDGNGVKVAEYISEFAGYDLSLGD